MQFVDFVNAVSIIFQLIIIEGLLSIDNATVLAALAMRLPDGAEPPKPLNHTLIKDIFGHEQRSSALKIGILGAYIGRGLMLVIASFIIRNQYLKIIGASYLIYLAYSHFKTKNKTRLAKDGKSPLKKKVEGFWSTVIAIELADLTFSLDNVITAVSISNDLWVVIAGVFLGIAVMRFGATLIMHIMEREPILADAAYLLIVAIAVELLMDQLFGIEVNSLNKFFISIGILVGTVLSAKVRSRLVGSDCKKNTKN